MNNKQLGNKFEREFCNLLAEKNIWCHRLQDNKNGQPADIIASKANNPVLIDCKVCINNVFQLSRMEENQINAMRKWTATGNGLAFFALKIGDEVRMLQYQKLMELRKQGVKSLKYADIIFRGALFDDWAEVMWGVSLNEG